MAANGLAPGWEAVESRSTPGDFYYRHAATGETTWEKPLAQTGAPATAGASSLAKSRRKAALAMAKRQDKADKAQAKAAAKEAKRAAKAGAGGWQQHVSTSTGPNTHSCADESAPLGKGARALHLLSRVAGYLPRSAVPTAALSCMLLVS